MEWYFVLLIASVAYFAGFCHGRKVVIQYYERYWAAYEAKQKLIKEKEGG